MLFNIQSEYSFLESTLRLNKYAIKAKEYGYQSIGIADTHVLYGSLELYQLAKKHHLRPLIGLRVILPGIVDSEVPYEFLLYATSKIGYYHLGQLSRQLLTDSVDTSVIWQYLQYQAQDLVYISSSNQNELLYAMVRDQTDQIQQLHNFLVQIFGQDKIYIGVNLFPSNEYELKQVDKWSKKLDIPVIISQYIHALNSEDGSSIQMLQSIKANQPITKDLLDHQTEYYMRPYHIVKEQCACLGYTEWLTNTSKLEANIAIQIEPNKEVLPQFHIPETFDHSASYLKHLVMQRLTVLGLSQKNSYIQRIEHELQIIHQMGFDDYFLIVWEIIQYCHQQKIPVGPGRGSAAGSLIAYLLEITQVDPLEYNLIFERFLNPERLSLPDIDIDISDESRSRVIHFLAQVYGENQVAQIITFSRFGAKSVLRDILKALEVDEKTTKQWLQLLPSSTNTTLSLKSAYDQSEAFRDYVHASKINEQIYRMGTTLDGLPRQSSTHAGAVVISQQPIDQLIPVRNRPGEVLLTQLPMDQVEQMGLLKIDILGLKNLTLLDQMKQQIQKNTQSTVDWGGIPLDDPATLKLFQQGDTNGIFQFESAGIKKVLKTIYPTSFDDIVAVNALYRPGPMKQIETFNRRKRGQEPIPTIDPSTDQILKATYGVIVYQEQVMQIAVQMAGFTYGQADSFRRAIASKNLNLLDSFHQSFVEGAIQRHHSPEISEQVFQYILAFANYGFNRSHSVVYSYLAFQMAYCKAHYPAEFYAALINSGSSSRQSQVNYIQEAQRVLGKTLPLDINLSEANFTARPQLRVGFNAIRGVRKSMIDAMLEARSQAGKFTSFINFLQRLPERELHKESLQALILTGCFDTLESNRRTLVTNLDSLLQSIQYTRYNMSLFEALNPKINYVSEFSRLERIRYENDYLGFTLSGHPLEAYQSYFQNGTVRSLQSILADSSSGYAETLAIIKQVKIHRTKKGDEMAFVTLTDMQSELSAVLFPSDYLKYRRLLSENAVLRVRGKIEWRNQRKQLIIQSILDATPDSQHTHNENTHTQCFIQIHSFEALDQAANYIGQFSDPTYPIDVIIVNSERKAFQLDSSYRLNYSIQLEQKLKGFFGNECVVFK